MSPAQEQYATERRFLEEIVKIGERFRNCPIVDDEFPALVNEFDSVLLACALFVKKNKPLRCTDLTAPVHPDFGPIVTRIQIQ